MTKRVTATRIALKDRWIDVQVDTCPLPKGMVRQSGVTAELHHKIAKPGTAKA